MSVIEIEGMHFHAYHGCFEQEQIIGTKFTVDLYFETDTSAAEKFDDLSATVDYQSVYNLVKEEMGINSKLLEHVGRRILDRLFVDFPAVENATLTVSKLNPPLGGEIKSVGVKLSRRR